MKIHIDRPSTFVCDRCHMSCYTAEHLKKHKVNCERNRARTTQKTAGIRVWRARKKAEAAT